MVIGAAILHAVWNALVKSGADKTLGIAAVVMGQGVFALLALPFAAVPDWACWPWFVASIALHIGYQFFLGTAYRMGDLTQVYPIARGVAPLIVGGVSVTLLGVALEAMELIAIGIIAAGIMSRWSMARARGWRARRWDSMHGLRWGIRPSIWPSDRRSGRALCAICAAWAGLS